jgi:hypothetical protein
MTVYELANFEDKYSVYIRAFRDDAVNAVLNVKSAQVKMLANNMAIVQASSLGCPGASWMPSYYIQSEQARAVKAVLHRCMTAQALIDSVVDMINDKKVKVNRETVFLNPGTICALKLWLERSKEHGFRV